MLRIHSTPLITACALTLLAGACAGENPADSDDGISSLGDGGGGSADDDTRGDADVGDEATTLDGDEGCSGNEDCPPNQVCLPASGQCGPPGSCQINEDCPDGQVCDDTQQCNIGGDCGGFEFEIEAVPPNLLILLDRSGSMNGGVPGTNLNRWEVAKQAIAEVTTNFNDQIRFGLATYSSCVGNGCSAGSVVVGIADSNAGAINGFLDGTVGEGSNNGNSVNGSGKIEYLCDSGDPETSTGASLQALVGDPILQDSERENAVMLITDGSESGDCVNGGINGPVAAGNLFGQAIAVRTFAVGFGGANVGEINNIAQSGGTGQGYLADMAADLNAAFAQIANAVATCTFELDQVPPDASQIFVFFDKDPGGVPNNPSDGWTYDPVTNSVTFHGPACEAIKSGAVVEIDIVYGCNEPPIG